MISRRVAAAAATVLMMAAVVPWSFAQSPPPVPLPDPLAMANGSRVTTADQWFAQRKPELRAQFEELMYGRAPAAPEPVAGRTLFADNDAFGGRATLREVELTFGPPEWPKIYLLVASPNVERAAACFVGLNFGGNHLRLDDKRIRLPTAWMQDKYPGVVDHRATEAGRGKQGEGSDQWPLEEAINRGYAIATFYCGDIQPDRPDVREAMRATLPDVDDPAATATIMWWAWGVSRAVDYLVADPHVDGKRLAVVGHSRLGKAALVAGALDDRIALTIPSQAGCGGSGPSRHNDPRAETVAIITKNNRHWFCGNFATFGADTTRLPFDQNGLVAMCAPRPVLFNAAAEDVWANPVGQFEVLRAATPVYELLGVEGLATDAAMPAAGEPMIDSRLGFAFRKGVHSLRLEDWQTFFDYADKWLP
jgi:hypothetical protein